MNWTSNPISTNLELINLAPPSSEPSPSLELKALPTHLKYLYLGEQETFPVIIASHLMMGKKRISRQFLENIGKSLVGL